MAGRTERAWRPGLGRALGSTPDVLRREREQTFVTETGNGRPHARREADRVENSVFSGCGTVRGRPMRSHVVWRSSRQRQDH